MVKETTIENLENLLEEAIELVASALHLVNLQYLFLKEM